MKEVQLDIFTLNDDEKISEVINSIKNKLLKYKTINKKYKDCYKKTSTPLLRTIKESLENDKEYNNYITDLVGELKRIAPYYDNTDCMYEIKVSSIFKNNDNYIYKVGSFTIKNIKYNGQQGPLYHFDMLPRHFFEELIK